MIAFHRVKKSPLIIGIVDQTKINGEKLFPFSESELSHTFCKLQVSDLRLFRSFRGDSLGMDKSSSAKCLLYSDVVKGEPSPTGRGRRRKSRHDQSRSWRYSFHKHFTTFFNLFLFFNYFTLSLFFYTFFTQDIYPHPHPRPLPTTHDPRPTTFSYTQD